MNDRKKKTAVLDFPLPPFYRRRSIMRDKSYTHTQHMRLRTFGSVDYKNPRRPLPYAKKK